MKKLFGHADRKAQDWEEYDEQDYDWDSGDDMGEDDYPYADDGEIEDEEAYYGEDEYAGAAPEGKAVSYRYGEDVRGEGYYEAEDSVGDPAGDYGREDGYGGSVGYYGAEDGYGESADYYGQEDGVQDVAGYWAGDGETDSPDGYGRDAADYYGEEDGVRESDGYYGVKDSEKESTGYYGRGDSREAGGYYSEEDASGYRSRGGVRVAGGYYGEEESSGYYRRGDSRDAADYYGEEDDTESFDDGYDRKAASYGRNAGSAHRSGSLYGEQIGGRESGSRYGRDGSARSSSGRTRMDDREDYYRRKTGAGASAGRYQRDAEDEEERRGRGAAQSRKRQQPEGFFVKVAKAIRSMDAMDRIMVAGGVGVLVLALILGSVFINASITDRQVSDFEDVGKQLDGITTIGEKGLLAVADAELARQAAASIVQDEEQQEPEEPDPGYNESGYERQVAVQPSFTSIQKDLKIKFVNKRTEKLVANVPFSVTVTDPDGKTAIWSDDDMDGIIYKKDIASGTYKVAMEALTDKKYADYSISTQAQSVEVRKEISYNKVDVSNEVKQESEVNAKKEDTKKNEVVVESSLQDTVPWVESKVLAASYEEVAKNTIPDPMTLVLGKGLLRMSESSSSDSLGSAVPTESSSLETSLAPITTPTPEPTETPPVETPTPTPDPTQTPIQTPTPDPTQTPTPDPTQTPTPSPTPTVPPARKAVTVTVNPASISGSVGSKLAAKATATGSEGKDNEVECVSVSSDNASVATATIAGNGDVTIQCKAAGTAKLTVKANYKKDGKAETEGSAVIEVTVREKLALTLDKTSLTVYTTATADITVSTGNTGLQQAGAQTSLTAVSSDTSKATVSVKDKVVTVTGVAEGSATITVNYEESGEKASATCAVTVKKHPKEDKTTLLKDTSGRQIYVSENNTYREATRSDYYTAAKFYIRGEAKYTGWQTINGKVYYFTADGNKVTGEQVIQGAKYNFASDGSLVVGNGTMGIDVSKWNGNIDWNAVKNSGVSYVIIRSGYRGSSTGKLVVDPKFEANIKGATAVGLKVGIYFFSQAVDEREAVEEASMVLGQIKNYKISYPVFLDVEASGGRGDSIDSATRTAVCKAFCQTVQNAGYTAGVYSNKNWLEGKLDSGSLNAYKIWLAQYAASPTYKGRYDLWQYRSTGSVSGISGNVDMNISYLGY